MVVMGNGTNAPRRTVADLSPSSFVPRHLDVSPVVVVWDRRDTSDGWLVSELKLLPADPVRWLALLEYALGAGILSVCKCRHLQCGSTSLIESGVSNRRADGRGRDGGPQKRRLGRQAGNRSGWDREGKLGSGCTGEHVDGGKIDKGAVRLTRQRWKRKWDFGPLCMLNTDAPRGDGSREEEKYWIDVRERFLYPGKALSV